MRETRGIPIAAYLGVLVAIALAAAFFATLAIVIFLPPRPPDVMRADVVADNFQAGYDHMIALDRPMNERGMVWDVRGNAPAEIESPAMAGTRIQLAEAIDLRPDQIRIQASNGRLRSIRSTQNRWTASGIATRYREPKTIRAMPS